MNRQVVLLSTLGAVLVIALWWFLLYNPGRADLAAVEAEIAAAEAEEVSLQQRIAALEAVRAAAPESEALLAQYAGIIPTEPALESALRQITAAAEDAGVELDSVASQRPSPVGEDPTGLHSISLTLNLRGSYFQLVDFLRRLEDPTITARGILVTSLSVNPTEYPTLSAAITGTMFAVLEASPQAEEAADGDVVAPADDATEPAEGGDAEPTEGDDAGAEAPADAASPSPAEEGATS